ncbi:MAG TPA: rhodanese-like domain-containing protein [Gemmatimonadaceae bacterium]|nr:rhodanese-like domain-containing protein [Gemmatimonadaceae bacterium]
MSTQSSKPGVREVPAPSVIAMRERGDDVTFVDVREQHEWNLFRIGGAVHIPLGTLRDVAPRKLRPEQAVVLYCARGGRAATGAATLVELGFANVMSIEGGLMGWVNAGGPLDE